MSAAAHPPGRGRSDQPSVLRTALRALPRWWIRPLRRHRGNAGVENRYDLWLSDAICPRQWRGLLARYVGRAPPSPHWRTPRRQMRN